MLAVRRVTLVHIRTASIAWGRGRPMAWVVMWRQRGMVVGSIAIRSVWRRVAASSGTVRRRIVPIIFIERGLNMEGRLENLRRVSAQINLRSELTVARGSVHGRGFKSVIRRVHCVWRSSWGFSDWSGWPWSVKCKRSPLLIRGGNVFNKFLIQKFIHIGGLGDELLYFFKIDQHFEAASPMGTHLPENDIFRKSSHKVDFWENCSVVENFDGFFKGGFPKDWQLWNSVDSVPVDCCESSSLTHPVIEHV